MITRKKPVVTSLLRGLAFSLLGLASATPTLAADPVTLTLYNGQHKEIGEAVAKAFEADTGIKVNIRKGGSGQLASQITEEGKDSPADLIYTEESPPLSALAEKGLLAKADQPTLDVLPKEYVAQDGTWVGVTARTRVIVYNPTKIKEDQLPKSLMDLAKPEWPEAWDGKIGFVPTSGGFQEQASAIILRQGEEAAENWLTSLRAFGKTYANNMVALKAVENGEVNAVLVNNYYWYALKRERGQLTSRIYYVQPHDIGRLVSISGAAVVKATKHPKEAQQLLNWMVSERGQRVITQTTAEYPLHKGMVSDQNLQPWEELAPPNVTPADVGNAENALQLEQDIGLL